MGYHKFTILISSFLLLPYFSYSQQPTSRIEKLRIGGIHSSLSFSGSSFGDEIWGRYSNGHYYPWFSVFENPAFVSGTRFPKILFQWAPGQNYGLTRISDVSAIINEKVDNNVRSYKSENLEIGYPSMNAQLKRQIQWPEGMILFPIDKFTMGLIFHRSFSMSLNLDWIGMESSISTVLSSSNRVILNNYLDAVNRFDYWVTSTGFFISGVLGKRFVAGMQLERLYFNLSLHSNWNVQGAMFYNGKEYLFNDPETLWPTDITQELQAEYAGDAWRVNWGGMYAFGSNVIIDGTISTTSDAKLEGSLAGRRNKIPALNIDALKSGGGVDEILDPEQLNPSQLTLTESIGWDEHPVLTHTMPTQLKIGLFYKTGKWAFYLSERIYFGNYRLQYGDDYVEITPRQRFNFYLARGGFFTKMGLLSLKFFAPESQDFSSNSSSLPIPFVSLGYSKELIERVVIIGGVELLPIPGVNFGVQYQF